MANGDDLALYIEELKQLQSIAKRSRVVSYVSSEIRNLEKQPLHRLSKYHLQFLQSTHQLLYQVLRRSCPTLC